MLTSTETTRHFTGGGIGRGEIYNNFPGWTMFVKNYRDWAGRSGTLVTSCLSVNKIIITFDKEFSTIKALHHDAELIMQNAIVFFAAR